MFPWHPYKSAAHFLSPCVTKVQGGWIPSTQSEFVYKAEGIQKWGLPDSMATFPSTHPYTLYLSIRTSIHPYICTPIHPSTPSIYTTTYPSIYPSIYTYIYLSIHTSIYTSIHLSILLSNHPPSQTPTHSSIHPTIHSPFLPFILPSIHPSILPSIEQIFFENLLCIRYCSGCRRIQLSTLPHHFLSPFFNLLLA